MLANESNAATLLFHDYETWGVNPQLDFACQFAAVRTDLELNIIGKPHRYFCQIPNDYLPHPDAVLVTGITPQQSIQEGSIEAEFAQRIHDLMSRAGTCVVGYNSIRFDDEVTRHLLYRNFYDPYAREWQQGNSRWDIIDLVRACYALRPEGIEWPFRDDGTPSFKLEELTASNNIAHEGAHDAVADVLATIELAKLIKAKQPKLFDYYFSLRQKQAVLKQLVVDGKSPVLHVSGMIPSAQGCCTWVLPICQHPTNKNAVICVDLHQNIDNLIEYSAEQLHTLLYSSREDIPDNENRPAIKLLHVNKCPFIATAKSLTPDAAQRLGIDRQLCLQNLKKLSQTGDLASKLSALYEITPTRSSEPDIDAALYTREFPSAADKQWMESVRHTKPEALAGLSESAPNSDYQAQLFRFRGRNFPNSFDEQELHAWQRHRHQRLVEGGQGYGLNASAFQSRINELADQYADTPKKLRLLATLEQYLAQM